MKTKYQTIEITKANLTAAGRYTDSPQLDDNYDVCDGVQAIELGAGGITYYSIGIEDKRDVYSPIVHKNDYIATTAVPINHRYKDILIPIVRGEKTDVKTEIPVVLAAELKYLLIFRLRKATNNEERKLLGLAPLAA